MTDFIRCDCCSLPVARVVGQTVVITVRHHGEKHVTVIALQTIQQQVDRREPIGVA